MEATELQSAEITQQARIDRLQAERDRLNHELWEKIRESDACDMLMTNTIYNLLTSR